jgi:hypothetical protein
LPICTANEFGLLAFWNYRIGTFNNLTLRTEFYDDLKGQRTGYTPRVTLTSRPAGSIGSARRLRSAQRSATTGRPMSRPSTMGPLDASGSSAET